MKSLSEQMQDLSARAKKAEDDAATARSEARTQVQARSEQLQADAAARKAQVDAAAASAKDEIAKRWANLQALMMSLSGGRRKSSRNCDG